MTFDRIVHAPHRLRICALLEPLAEAEFSQVRDAVAVSDSVLSKHVAVLVDAGYVEQRRATKDARRRVWLRLTPRGRNAFIAHVAALREIIDQVPRARHGDAVAAASGRDAAGDSAAVETDGHGRRAASAGEVARTAGDDIGSPSTADVESAGPAPGAPRH